MNVPSATAGLLAEALTNEGGVRGTFCGEDDLLHFGDWRAEYAALGNSAGVVSLAPHTIGSNGREPRGLPEPAGDEPVR